MQFIFLLFRNFIRAGNMFMLKRIVVVLPNLYKDKPVILNCCQHRRFSTSTKISFFRKEQFDMRCCAERRANDEKCDVFLASEEFCLFVFRNAPSAS